MRQVLCASLLLAVLPTALLAVPGTPDRIRAATLLVPYFETGVDPATHPDDTLLAVMSVMSDQMIHVQVWDVDGHPVALYRNVLLHSSETWDAAMRDLINSASPAVRTALRAGSFYRGFVTIDAVTAATGLHPLQAAYPFSPHNYLEGYVYYTRLSKGSANGLSMVPLEYVDAAMDSFLRDFYPGGSREEIDANSRMCATQLSGGHPCAGDSNDVVDRVHFRQFGSGPLNGTTRIVLFTWEPYRTGQGPSMICDNPAEGCSSSYPLKVYAPGGSVALDTMVRLDHVVNVFDVTGPTSAWVSIWNVPDIGNDLQVYGFSFNSAAPGFDPSLTWDAIFEAYIIP